MLSYSGAGEDRVALAWLEQVYGRNPRTLRYCDVGANHPIVLSNTFLPYTMGATGVLVEPDPDLCAQLRVTRSRDIVINAGAAFDERRSAKLKRLNSRVFNTFLAHQAETIISASEGWHQKQAVVDEIDVPLLPMNDILAKHFSSGIDFISIDTEGVEFQVLASIDLNRFKPTLICIEATADFSVILGPAGYHQIAQTPDNFIFRLMQGS
jgi:FkbM family methyltransferase